MAKASGPKSISGNGPVLIVQTAFLGDLLLMIPLLKRIRKLRPQSKLYLVARAGYGRLIHELGLVDQVEEIVKNDNSSYDRAIQKLRRIEFDLILCPHESATTAQFCWKIPAQLKVGFYQWWNFIFFKERVAKDLNLPEPLRQMSLLRNQDQELASLIRSVSNIDLKNADEMGRLPEVPAWASLSMREFLLSQVPAVTVAQKTICVFPGSVWPTKQWTENGFAQLGQKLSKEGFALLWLGSKDEGDLCKRLEQKVPHSRSLAGSFSLLQTLIILAHSEAVISNDSAGGHLAAVADAPSVSIFGPTILDQGFRPWSSKALIAELFNVECRPCGRHGHKKCPIQTHICMTGLPDTLVRQRLSQLRYNL